MALPCEMVDEILCRVPVKYILRCRSVCKGWCSLIDSTAFAKKHLKTSRDRNAGVGLMITKLGGDRKVYLASLDSLDEDSAAVVKIRDPLKTFLFGAEFVGACHGLMCVLKNKGEDVFVLNPIIRKVKKIPSRPADEFPSFFRVIESRVFGFGYDEVNDDYKVVIIADCCVQFRGLVVIVYSFKTNAWTRIQNVPSNIRFTGMRGIFASGSLHWMAVRNSEDIIVGFDLELQQFKEVPFPPIEVTHGSSKSRFLADVGEYLCILDCPNSHMDVWLMNYPGAESTWYKAISTKQEEILRARTSNELLAFSRSGKDLLLQVCNPYYTKLAWYNLSHETVTNVGIRGLPFHFCSFLYTESLLQINEDEPLQQKPSEDNQEKNTMKRRRDKFLSRGSRSTL